MRRSVVTRLGERVDSGGRLSEEAIARVRSTLDEYSRTIVGAIDAKPTSPCSPRRCETPPTGPISRRWWASAITLDARTLTGDEEAQLTFLGAMSDQQDERDESTVVIDIGGGSTEFIVGSRKRASFHTSLQAGVVRMGERHIRSDPPAEAELESLAADTRAIYEAGLPREWRSAVSRAIAVAGTATSAASMAQQLDPYDPERVHGFELSLATVQDLLDRLAALEEGEGARSLASTPTAPPRSSRA